MQTIIHNLRDSYEAKYKSWCLKNPGAIMCNYAIKCDTLNNVIRDNLSFGQIIEKEKWHRETHKEVLDLYGMSGHYICAEVLNELIELIANEEENRSKNHSG